MRFRRRRHPMPYDERTRRFFAVLPVTVGDETRWLETVTVRQVYMGFVSPPFAGTVYRWTDAGFVDNE